MLRDRYSAKELESLRVGDRVRIHLEVYRDEERGRPFDVEITAIDHEFNFDHNGIGRPMIHWEPRPDIDYITLHDGTRFPAAACDSSHITEILERARYECRREITNQFAKARSVKSPKIVSFYQRRSGHVALHTEHLAREVLSRHPYLYVPYGISSDKLHAEWQNAGQPGLKGMYDYSTGKVVTLNDRDAIGNEPRTISEAMLVPWIRVSQFQRWLLRRLPHIIVTKSEFKAAMIESYAQDVIAYEDDWDVRETASFDEAY